ncbi:MAG: hypothetical protein WC659_03965 [Patescibacteria group bacterium]
MKLIPIHKAFSYAAMFAVISTAFTSTLFVSNASANAILSLGLSVTKNEASPGDIIGYTVTYANTAFENADNIRIILDYDEHLLTPHDIGSAVQSLGTVIYTQERLTQKTTEVRVFWFTIKEQLPSGTTTISAFARLSADNVSSLTTPTVNISAQAKPVLVATVSADKDTVRQGDLIAYTISYRNDGNTIARNTILTDDFDEQNADIIQTSTGGSVQAGEVRWSVGNFYPGQKAIQTVTVRVRGSSTLDKLTNMVTITADNATRFDYLTSTTLLDAIEGNDSLSVRMLVSDENEYRVTSHTAYRGERVNSEIIVTNYSGSRAEGILVSLHFDPLYFDILDSQGGIKEKNTLYWEIDQLDNGEVRTWNPVFQVTSNAPYQTPVALTVSASAKNYQIDSTEIITTILSGTPRVRAAIQESPRTGPSALLSILVFSIFAGVLGFLYKTKNNSLV